MTSSPHHATPAAPAGTGAPPTGHAAGAREDARRYKPATRFLVSLPFALVISFLMLWGVPKVVPSSDAITHVTARAQSALVGAFYPAARRDDVTVLLIDDTSLAEAGQGWPVPYRTHARWLSVLGQAYKPRAIFVDITFTQARDDATLPALVQALCRLRDRGVPVFLAALPGADGRLALRPGLATPAGEAPCFTLVGVDYEADRIDRLIWNYPLWREAGGHEGRHENRAHGGERSEARDEDSAPPARSAALAVAEDAAGVKLEREEAPMALVWGVDNAGLPRFAEWCRPYAGPGEVLPPALRALWAGDEALKPICPYSRALTMRELKPATEADAQRLRERIDGRFVLIGTSMAGSNDLVASPVHGPIPGVFMHAMALDNLLTYGARYKRALEWEMPPPWRLAVLGLVAVALTHLLLHRRRLFGGPPPRHARGRWRRQPGVWLRRLRARLRHACTTGARGPRDRHLSAFLLGAGRVGAFLSGQAWRVAYSTLAIMLFIVGAQWLLDVGTLPVVDLAAMALAAEWFGWTRKITDIALGTDPDEPPLTESHHPE
ncbi:CHASE2 domain-containing protein [Cupriavidus basilensis]|uniref:CHASE2 domain-containing protein n=1 Tax=Cupriavidus basilensis TaxID=68895 RepID=UPI0007515C19|nr:CHASE2 domain-containing protein [Cupriavidus basilensis]